MQIPANRRNFARIAAFLGVIQGLAWAALSLAAIILYNLSRTYDLEDPANSYTRNIGLRLHYLFIEDNPITRNFINRPSDFTIFMWIYFIMSVGWVALSLDQFVAVQYNKTRQKKIIFLWGVVTLIISLVDLIFTALLARDFSTCYEYKDVPVAEEMDGEAICYLGVGIVMTLAARGYTLWLVNVIFSFYMLRVSIKIKKRKELPNLFSDHSIPRVILPRSTNNNSELKSGELTPNYLNNERSFPPYLPQNDRFDQEDTLRSFQSRSDNSSLNRVPSRAPSFLSRGDKFSY